MTDDAAPLLVGSGQESRNVDEGHEWEIECIAESDESRRLAAGIDIEAPREDEWLIGNDPHGSALQAGEADDDVLGERELEEAAIIEDLTDDGFDIIGFGGIRWYQVAQGRATSVSRVLCALDRRWSCCSMADGQPDQARSMACSSLSAVKWDTPDFAPWVMAPPRSPNVTSSLVTVLMTSGPVMNM